MKIRTLNGRTAAPILASCLAGLAGIALAGGAGAQERVWSAQGTYEDIVITDCRECGDDIGMMVACRGAGQPAEVTVHRAAMNGGREGMSLPLQIEVDGQVFTRPATTVLFGQIGYAPQFALERGDPLIAALQAGRVARVTFGGTTANISLGESRFTFDIFIALCWNSAGAAPAAAPDDGLEWYVADFTDAASGQPGLGLSYGIRETDAFGFAATCGAGTPAGAARVVLPVDVGARPHGAGVAVAIRGPGLDGTNTGQVLAQSSEFAGVGLQIGLDDPLWQALLGAGEVSFGVPGLAQTSVPTRGARRPVSQFLDDCRTRFAGPGAGSGAAPAAQADVFTTVYTCSDGSRLTARFDNSGPESIAFISHDGGPQAALISVISGSGARYSNGEFTLHTKNDEAVFSRGGAELVCHAG